MCVRVCAYQVAVDLSAFALYIKDDALIVRTWIIQLYMIQIKDWQHPNLQYGGMESSGLVVYQKFMNELRHRVLIAIRHIFSYSGREILCM